MAGIFELAKGKSGKFHFNLHAGNKRVILTSEAYNSKAAALAGINAVRKNSQLRERFQRRSSKGGRPYFVLLARNGEVIGQSQRYVHDTSCYVGIRSVMSNARKAPLRENSHG
jgi:uncharacterized protein YegP (UPF0339 family)